MLWRMIEKDGLQKRVRRNRGEIGALLAAFRESNLSQAAFAQEHKLNLGTFRSWLSKFRPGVGGDKDRMEGFCAVTLREGGNGPFLLRLPGGIEIEVSSQVDPRWMIEFVKGLQS